MMVDMKEGKKMSKSNQGTFFAMYTKLSSCQCITISIIKVSNTIEIKSNINI